MPETEAALQDLDVRRPAHAAGASGGVWGPGSSGPVLSGAVRGRPGSGLNARRRREASGRGSSGVGSSITGVDSPMAREQQAAAERSTTDTHGAYLRALHLAGPSLASKLHCRFVDEPEAVQAPLRELAARSVDR